MIENFQAEVESKLRPDEDIEKMFVAPNYEMLKEGPNITAFSSSALMGTGDYSFTYSIIITNKRIFIGNANPYFKVISYKIYDIKDLKNIEVSTYDSKKKFNIMPFYYFFGLLPIVLVADIFLNEYISELGTIDSQLAIYFISLAIPVTIIYGLYRLIRKFAYSKLVTDISFSDGNELCALLGKKSDFNFLKKLSINKSF
ncbi:hypothetical protein ACQPU1_17065 [Clostridium paraputrificum]|uniref:hypothetical protein n=1 Tax=Clostridium paraputrificum TaxID=29363 RepID=UPI003D3478C1